MNELRILWLPLAVMALAIAILTVDIMGPPSASRQTGRASGWLVALGLSVIFGASFFLQPTGRAASGAYLASPFALFLQRLFLGAGALSALSAIDDVEMRTPKRQGEYWLLFLTSILGMVVLPAARDLILVVVAFELMGIPLYIMAAYAKTDAANVGDAPGRGTAPEAAIKFYLVGAGSSAVTLFGLALLTGMAQTTRLDALASMTMTPLAAMGIVMVLGGMGYKVGMVPFHMWVPDTYQGASLPFVAFLSVAPKAAGVGTLAVLLLSGLGAHQSAWLGQLSILALLSMGVGNLLALPQTDLRRLLAYSGIAQMGYVLVGVAGGDAPSMGMTLFFLASYVVTNLGAFFVIFAAAQASGEGNRYDVSVLYGLSRRSPGLAAMLLCFLLSLAGIPFVVGFWAKLYVFLAAWQAHRAGLVIAGITFAVLGLFYYLRILRAAYMVEGAPDRPAPRMPLGLRLALGVCLVAVVGLGLWPQPLVEQASRAGSALVVR